ncbi:MAG: Rieske (2Fe-2S) protein [Acidobacteriaceae bacterium]|jgi:Rieske Fe-S protein|nr:Rieske (2Fe-2S) protein [Acidobacteriaceae bacterium]
MKHTHLDTPCAGTHCDRGAVVSIQDLPESVGRRLFFIQSALMAAGAAIAACGSGDGNSNSNGNIAAPSLPTGTSVNVSSYPALANVGGIATTTLGKTPVAIIKTGASSFTVLSLSCPHQGTTVRQQGSGFQCPNHGATFNQSGQWTGGQRTSNLRSYTTSFDATTGTLTIG